MSKKEDLELTKKEVERKALEFVQEKGHTEKTYVMNLETGEYYGYQLPPFNALKAAYIANIMRCVGRIIDPELVVYFSASQEFEELDDKIEFAANNTMMRLGSLYTYATEDGRQQLDEMIGGMSRSRAYRRFF